MKLLPLRAALVLGSLRIFEVTLFDILEDEDENPDTEITVVNVGGDFQLGFQPPLTEDSLEDWEDEEE